MNSPQLFSEPWIVRLAVDWLDKWLQPQMSAFEWGSGASSLWLAHRVDRVTTVDHDERWTHALVRESRTQGMGDRMRLLTLPALAPDFAEYSGAIGDTGLYDLIFIDGFEGSRLASARRAMAHLAEGAAILLDSPNADSNAEARDFLAARFSSNIFFHGPIAQPGIVEIGETALFLAQRP